VAPETPPPPAGRRTARALFRRARWQQWLGRPQQALALCRQAVEHADYSRAYTLMSRLTLPGESYFGVLRRIHAYLKPATYLEIGVARGESLALASPDTAAIGIDPSPQLARPLRASERIFATTSDEFFAQHDLRAEFGGRALELAFIDGMHRFEYALRDFINVERACTRAAVILVHDCYPLDARTAQREQQTRFWSGDIWRLIVLLKEYRPDLAIHTIGAPPTGLGLITHLDPASKLLASRLPQLIAAGLALDFSAIAQRRPEALNLLPYDWPRVRQLLDGR